MLQQTPVERVREPWARWLERWPTPADLAAAPSGEAVRAWGRLGYPRRALRLHGAAVAITERFGGEVPADLDDLRSLPGRRRLHRGRGRQLRVRAARGRPRHERPPGDRPAGRRRGVPGRGADPGRGRRGGGVPARRARPTPPAGRSPRWSSGAVVCTARAPALRRLPGQPTSCAWRRAGYPAWAGPPRRGQTYEGTDRQCRGALLAVLRSSDEPVDADELAAALARAGAARAGPRLARRRRPGRRDRAATAPAGRCPADAPPDPPGRGAR